MRLNLPQLLNNIRERKRKETALLLFQRDDRVLLPVLSAHVREWTWDPGRGVRSSHWSHCSWSDSSCRSAVGTLRWEANEEQLGRQVKRSVAFKGNKNKPIDRLMSDFLNWFYCSYRCQSSRPRQQLVTLSRQQFQRSKFVNSLNSALLNCSYQPVLQREARKCDWNSIFEQQCKRCCSESPSAPKRVKAHLHSDCPILLAFFFLFSVFKKELDFII